MILQSILFYNGYAIISAMIKNIRFMLVEAVYQFMWCIAMSFVYLLMVYCGLSETVIASIFPVICFYSLYFFYDFCLRWLNRRCKVVFRV